MAYGAFIRPLYTEVTLLRGKLLAQQRLFEDKREAVQKVESLIKQYQGAGSLQDGISLSLPRTEEISSVFNQAQSIAAANNMRIEVFNVQPLPFKSSGEYSLVRPVGAFRITLRLSGSYEAFKNFIRGLETNIRVMDVVTMKIEPPLFNVVADTYYQSE